MGQKTGGERLLTVGEAAKRLGLKPSTLYQWSYQRRIRVVKLFGALRIQESVIDDLIAASVRPALRQQPSLLED